MSASLTPVARSKARCGAFSYPFLMASDRIISLLLIRYKKRAACGWAALPATIRCVYSTFTLAIPTTFRSLRIRTTIRTTRTRDDRILFICVCILRQIICAFRIMSRVAHCLDVGFQTVFMQYWHAYTSQTLSALKHIHRDGQERVLHAHPA